MRLLQYDNDGDFSLTEFYENDIPNYGILSHRWGAEEVTYNDVLNGMGKSKAGYGKIQFCGEQARRDGLQYFWVDTCCIDKSNAVELQEAINSMFRWYRDATKCYVHLGDVSWRRIDSADGSNKAWVSAFRKSAWFSRAWTLQELIAPASVDFFSREGELLGNKASLERTICQITSIPASALRGSPLSAFSVEERLSWAASRQTFHQEDKAYSILGIFDVHLPLIYGEGGRNAFRRLQKEILYNENRNRTSSHDADWADLLKTEFDENRGSGSDANSDIASIFSDGASSASSASTASLNPVQTAGIREVSQALLSQEILKALYNTAIRNIGRRKARAHIRGFLKEYGRNLLKETSNRSLEIQAAKFVQELAGRIADEISWSIAGFEEEIWSQKPDLAKKDLDNWLSSLQPQSVNAKKELRSLDPEAAADRMLEEEYDSDEELDSDLQFPSIDKVKGFLLNSEAFGTLVEAMRTWLKVDGSQSGDVEKPEPGKSDVLGQSVGNIVVHTNTEQVTQETPPNPAASGPDEIPIEHSGKLSNKMKIDSQQGTAQEQKLRSIQDQNRRRDLISSLLEFWGISFFFYDLVELFLPLVRPGYKRLRWRCSCNTALWGDFAVDDDHDLDQLKQDLSWWSVPVTQQNPSRDISMSQPNADSATGGPGIVHPGSMNLTGPSLGLQGVQPASPGRQRLKDVSDSSLPGTAHVVNIAFSPKFFEVCINIGNHAIDHHEINISHISSDGELFEMIWDKYNLSRGIGLRRFFLRPRSVDFVMFSVSRRTQYGAGIHKKPDEFPPQKELDEKRYHYLCPKIRMPVNVFLHYLHRARWNIWGEHTEDTWLQRLPKKLDESVVAKVQEDDATNQQDEQEALKDPNLAFGWGVHIIDGPNHSVLSLLLAIGVAFAFVISGMVVGFAKTQEQGFGVGSFLLAILAGIMAAVYFQLQDQ
ncbi:hypothetical protein IFR05_016268 [Cadophora sp. M221]|nr:hypothetical protein IFR05_016268 [Cadophora sp. M221]